MILPGTHYQSREKLKVDGIIHFDRPFSIGFKFELPVLEEFIISLGTDPIDNKVQVWLTNPKKYESEIVDKTTLNSPYYDSYSLLIDRKTIETTCELLTDFSEAIYFYSQTGKYGEFSNFSEFGFEHENLYYPTVEHFYQSKKFDDSEFSKRIRNAKTAKDASILGKSRNIKLKEDWDEIKSDIMFLAVRKKFEANTFLKELLLSTDDRLIIENSPYDNYWGIGMNGEGYNHLGTILMRVRLLLRGEI